MSILLINADSLHIPLADNSVQTCTTSPPYWGLRDYGVQDQLGLEPTPEQYVANMVAVFREVRRVLRDDGTCWLNLGDSYATNRNDHVSGGFGDNSIDEHSTIAKRGKLCPDGLKMKDLIGIPWRVAFALQADGWYLRSDIIWHKPNPMPESVTDRPTKSHEYVFLLTKNARYYFDQDAVREESQNVSGGGFSQKYAEAQPDHGAMKFERGDYSAGRNIRTVWTIPTQPTPFAHFATYPEKLVEPCIKAGTSERGRCPKCGKAWVRVTEVVDRYIAGGMKHIPEENRDIAHHRKNQFDRDGMTQSTKATTGWQPACSCDAGDPVPCIVLDPFAGSGTTGLVARRLGRHFVGLDLSRTYLHTIARRRLELDRLDAWKNGIQAGDDGWRDLPMFQGTQP